MFVEPRTGIKGTTYILNYHSTQGDQIHSKYLENDQVNNCMSPRLDDSIYWLFCKVLYSFSYCMLTSESEYHDEYHDECHDEYHDECHDEYHDDYHDEYYDEYHDQ